jgi:hypothetical protein
MTACVVGGRCIYSFVSRGERDSQKMVYSYKKRDRRHIDKKKVARYILDSNKRGYTYITSPAHDMQSTSLACPPLPFVKKKKRLCSSYACAPPWPRIDTKGILTPPKQVVMEIHHTIAK